MKQKRVLNIVVAGIVCVYVTGCGRGDASASKGGGSMTTERGRDKVSVPLGGDWQMIEKALEKETKSIRDTGADINARLKSAGEGVRWDREGQCWTSPSTGMEFVWIPALNMWVGKYEVTNGEYRKKEPGHTTTSVYPSQRSNGNRQPCANVNFSDIKPYAKWLTERERATGHIPSGYEYRLPTEDEWTIFIQCGDGREYPWGNYWPPRSGGAGNYSGQERDGRFGSMISGYSDNSVFASDVEESWMNPWGLYGVGGNVGEWTTTCSGDEFSAWRGASWDYSNRDELSCSFRFTCSADSRLNDVGFRLVLSRCEKQDSAVSSTGADPAAVSSEVVNERWIKNTYANGDITMSDKITGRMWLYSANPCGKKTWYAAAAYCKNLTYAGYSDWRLPYTSQQPELEEQYSQISCFTGVADLHFYWSGTSIGDDHALAISMANGSVDVISIHTACYVWPVRGGQ